MYLTFVEIGEEYQLTALFRSVYRSDIKQKFKALKVTINSSK